MFIQRMQKRTADMQFLALQQRLRIDDENDNKTKQHAYWQIDPEKS